MSTWVLACLCLSVVLALVSTVAPLSLAAPFFGASLGAAVGALLLHVIEWKGKRE